MDDVDIGDSRTLAEVGADRCLRALRVQFLLPAAATSIVSLQVDMECLRHA